MKKLFIFLFSLYLLVGAGEYVQSQDIETLWDIQVTTASKKEEKLSDAPGMISVVTNEEIEGFGATSLMDVLNRVTSMYMIHAGTYMWNLGSMRGQNVSVFDNHILILLNGRPLRDGISGGHNSVFYNSFPLEGIDHIEIIRGPGSVLYGTNAYSGVINIITKEAKEATAVEGSVSYGSFNTLSANVGGGIHVNDDLNINFGLRYFDDDGPNFEFFDGPKKGGSTLGNGNFTRDNKSAFVDLNYKGLKFMAGYGDIYPFGLIPPIKWDADGNSAGSEIKAMKHSFTDLGYTHEFNDKYSLSANVTYNGHKWEGLVDGDENGEKANSTNTLAEITFNGSPNEKLNFIVGGLYDMNSYKGSILNDGDINKFNAYLQADYHITDWLKLIGGFQLNKPQDIDANFTPRLGAVANFTENWGMKVLYSNAFRSPYPQETDVIHSVYKGNPLLKPELITTIEGQVFYQNDKIQTSLTVYNSHMEDLINKVLSDEMKPDSSFWFIFENEGTFDFFGVEFEGKFSLTDKIKLFSSLTYQTNEDGNGNENAAFWPQFMGKVGALYTCDVITAGLWNNYFGEPTQVENPVIPTLNPEATGYNMLTANITVDIFKLMKKESKTTILLSLYGDNLLDADVWFPEFARQEMNTLPLHGGRSFYGKLTFKL